MAIATMDGIVAGLATSKAVEFYLNNQSNAANGFLNLLRSALSFNGGNMPVPAAASSGGQLHADGDTGFPVLGTPTGSRYLARTEVTVSALGSILAYDRVWSCSGFSGTVTTAQAVASPPAITRYANGVGLEMWVECYAATGATAANITISYTNQDGVAGRTSVVTAHPTSLPAGRMYRVPLQAGDTGVKSVESVTLSASTGTAGNFGVTLMKRIASLPGVTASVTTVADFAALGLPPVPSGAAIDLIHLATSSNTGAVYGLLQFIEG